MSKTVAVVGTDLIGASWAALFLANGHKVIATDPAEGAETRLRAFIDDAWPTLQSLGLKDGADREMNLSFVKTPEDAVCDADFVQEVSAPSSTFITIA
jgi:3-hydroxyacyl-CoA dehydrogenase